MKKILIFLLITFIILSTSCAFPENLPENDDGITLSVNVKTKENLDDVEWKEKNYRLNSKEKTTLNILCEKSAKIEVSATLLEENEDLILVLDEKPNFDNILPGQYILKRQYSGYEPFVVKINVIEYRPALEVNYDGGDECQESLIDIFYFDDGNVDDGNLEKFSYFSYQYDGGYHYPAITLSYDGRIVYTIDREDFMSYVKPNSVESVERGCYRYTIELNSSLFESDYKNAFQTVRINVMVLVFENSLDILSRGGGW